MAWKFKINRIVLDQCEVQLIKALLDELFPASDQVDAEQFLDEAAVHAQDLPRRIRQAIYTFRLKESDHAICIAGSPINDSSLGLTPNAHKPACLRETFDRREALHVLYATLLGEPFAWSSIQNGYIINDVMPVREHSSLIASSGSSVLFDYHTEDAFHPNAGDYLGLMCLRNPTGTPTMLSGIEIDDLSPAAVGVLSEPRFIVGANIGQHVDRVLEPSPVLFGRQSSPYLRVNVNSTFPIVGDDNAARALSELVTAIRRNGTCVTLNPGECWYIDNYRVAHARDIYEPRFDGTDRWLKRLYITSAFRRSAVLRDGPSARLCHPERIN